MRIGDLKRVLVTLILLTVVIVVTYFEATSKNCKLMIEKQNMKSLQKGASNRGLPLHATEYCIVSMCLLP